jgi:hypothetical protein
MVFFKEMLGYYQVIKGVAEEVSDYRKIRIIQAIAKIISRMPVHMLEPLMNGLVSDTQSAFIKRRSIHKNFRYIKNLAKRFRGGEIPTLLFKLDIRKVSDYII